MKCQQKYVSSHVWLVAAVTLVMVLWGCSGIASAQATESIEAKSKKAGGKLSVALIPVDPNNAWTKPMMTAAFEDAMLKAGRFKVLSRSELDSVMKEQNFSASGMVDPASAVKLGKALSANYVVVIRQLSMESKQSTNALATFTGFGKKKTKISINLQAQVMDTETTELVQSETYSKVLELSANVMNGQQVSDDPSVGIPYKEALDEFAATFTTKLAASLPLEALVVMVKDARSIALGVGADAGLRPGTVFELIEEGEAIKGPDGEVLGYDNRTIGRVRVLKVDAKLTWTELIKTFSNDGSEDPTPDISKVKQYLLAKVVASN